MKLYKYLLITLLGLTLAACGDDKKENNNANAETEVSQEEVLPVSDDINPVIEDMSEYILDSEDLPDEDNLGLATEEDLAESEKMQDAFMQESNKLMVEQITDTCINQVHNGAENLSGADLYTAEYVSCLETQKSDIDEQIKTSLQQVIDNGIPEDQINIEEMTSNPLFTELLQEAQSYQQ